MSKPQDVYDVLHILTRERGTIKYHEEQIRSHQQCIDEARAQLDETAQLLGAALPVGISYLKHSSSYFAATKSADGSVILNEIELTSSISLKLPTPPPAEEPAPLELLETASDLAAVSQLAAAAAV